MRVEFVALGRVQATSRQVPAGPGITGQLVPQLQAQQLEGHVRDAHAPRDPQLHRAGRHLKKFRNVSRRKPQTGGHGFEALALFHAGLRATGLLGWWWLDLPRCILLDYFYRYI